MKTEGVETSKKKKLDASPTRKDNIDEVGAEATFPYNFYNQPKETEDRPREFSEFDPQTW